MVVSCNYALVLIPDVPLNPIDAEYPWRLLCLFGSPYTSLSEYRFIQLDRRPCPSRGSLFQPVNAQITYNSAGL